MRRLIGLALLLMLIPTPAHAGVRGEKCRYQSLDGHEGFNRTEVIDTIRCASHRFGVSTSTALYIADRESNFQPYARNSSSGACGIFQHMPQYFAGRLAAVPDHFRNWRYSCFNARSNILAALWMAHRYCWGAWGM